MVRGDPPFREGCPRGKSFYVRGRGGSGLGVLRTVIRGARVKGGALSRLIPVTRSRRFGTRLLHRHGVCHRLGRRTRTTVSTYNNSTRNRDTVTGLGAGIDVNVGAVASGSAHGLTRVLARNDNVNIISYVGSRGSCPSTTPKSGELVRGLRSFRRSGELGLRRCLWASEDQSYSQLLLLSIARALPSQQQS